MRTTTSLLFAFLSTLSMVRGTNGNIRSDFERCFAGGFGRSPQLVCDADSSLANSTKVKLNSLLRDLDKIECKCENGCKGPDGADKYIGVLLVTTSTKIADGGLPLNETAKEIYENIGLGNEDCDNGLLVVYIRDKQQLATYQGAGTFILLNSEEMAKLHSMATKHALGDKTLDLQYFLSIYPKVAMQSEIQRAETWTPKIGLWIAIILVLLALAVLLAMFLSRFCWCCRRSKSKDVYHVTTVPTYKTIEPLFIATPPPLADRIMAPPLSDVIYSTPYCGTPIPPPHFTGSRQEFYPGSVRSASVSQTATPASTHKNRIRALHAPIPRGFTPVGTPTMKSRTESNTVDDATQTNGVMPTARDIGRPSGFGELADTGPPPPPPQGAGMVPRSTDSSSIQRSTGYGDPDLSFLDPRRRLEVQTRTDFIY